MRKKTEDVFVYVCRNPNRLSAEKPHEKSLRLEKFCKERGYQKNGVLNIAEPISRCGSEIQWLEEYCHSHGIRKILVDSIYDIGSTNMTIMITCKYLCGQGFQVVIVSDDLIISGVETLPEEQDDECSLAMGGI